MAIDDNTSYELTGAQVKDLANKIKAKAADNIFVGATSAAPGSKGLVPQPQAGDDTKFLSGDGTWKVAPNVVQTMGQSTSDVMSQKAVTDMVYSAGYDPVTNQYHTKVRLGGGTGTGGEDSIIIGNTSNTSGQNGIALGSMARAGYQGVSIGSNAGQNLVNNAIAIGYNAGPSSWYGNNSISIGWQAGKNNSNNETIAIGSNSGTTESSLKGTIALGAYAQASATGEMNIGSTDTTYGYNSTNYRLLSGVHDPQGAHDAATKGYVDTLVGDIETALATINGN